MKFDNIVVMAHGKVRDVIIRHYYNWIFFTDNIYMICPEDDPVNGIEFIQNMETPNLPKYTEYACGVSQLYGDDCIKRTKFSVDTLAKLSGINVLIEYDTILLTPNTNIEILDGTMYMGEIWKNDESRFNASFFGHSPWIATQDTWIKLSDSKYTPTELGFLDRWIAATCEYENINISTLHGYSHDPIRPEHHPELRERLKTNEVFSVHGIKDILPLEIIKQSNNWITYY